MSTHHTPWHADDRDLAAYVAGGAPHVLAASLESHLASCPACRARIATLSDPSDREQAWTRLADVIDRPSRRSWVLRSAVATPAMLQAAVAAVLLVGLVPLLTATVAGDMGLVALLVLAPLAPVAAVALAYRDVSDPAGEIALATPAAGLRLVALRALLVAAVALPVAFLVLLAVDLWVQDVPVRLALAWCLPGLALAALTLLAGTTRLDPLEVALAAAGGWALLVAVAVTVHRTLRPEALADVVAAPALQSAALVVALGAVALTVVRRDAVGYRRTA
ncbi:MAG TPA: zf-HC2 domain-containing protein [Nocardioides sp.]|nr:zf-HC2 domain-containing protein [Nocardioides sp.]